MARKLEMDTAADPRGPSTAARSFGSLDRKHLNRRQYVKMSLLGAAAVTGATGTASADDHAASETSEDYETIELEAGEQRDYVLGDGETFENVLIDQRAEGAMFAFTVAEGADDWTIRNVGWKGVAPSGGGNRDYTFLIHVRGNGRIENIFIDQRNHDSGGEGSDVGAIWTYSDSHHGHIACRHNFIAGCGNNASYDSGDGYAHNASSGTVSHEYSYHRDNTPSNFRPGIVGSSIRNCVSIANDPDGLRGSYPANDSQFCRAVWGWHNPDLVVEDSAFWHDPGDAHPAEPFWATLRSNSDANACALHVVNCDINDSWAAAGNDLVHEARGEVVLDGLGSEPTVEVLGEGVPLTPEMAAAGERALPPEVGTAPGGGHGKPETQLAQSSGSIEAVHQDQFAKSAEDEPGGEVVQQGSVGNDDDGASVARTEPPSRTITSGFGLAGLMAGIGGAGYYLKRRFDEVEEE